MQLSVVELFFHSTGPEVMNVRFTPALAVTPVIFVIGMPEAVIPITRD